MSTSHIFRVCTTGVDDEDTDEDEDEDEEEEEEDEEEDEEGELLSFFQRLPTNELTTFESSVCTKGAVDDRPTASQCAWDS